MLFDKKNGGSSELAELTGQWYASTPYRLIGSEIDFAKREVASLVGSDVVSAAESEYESGQAASGFVNAVRLPIAFLAISRYAALSVVSHEGTGRKVKMDDNEKMPFEWMIDRDDRAMKERYYRAMDSLYEYLDDNKVKAWVSSGMKKALSESIVPSLTEFERVYPIDGSYYVYYKLQRLVIEAQKIELEPFFGDAWKDIRSNDHLLYLARSYAILRAVTMAASRWSLEVFPLEIAKRFSVSYQGNRESSAAVSGEIDWYLGKLEKQIKDLRHKIRLSIDGAAEEKLLPENDSSNKFFTVL